MRVALKPHPDTPCAALRAIEVEVLRPEPDEIHLAFFLAGDLTRVRFPPEAALERVDELWRHTCLEAFVRPDDGEGYVELNVAPSSQWAAYRFSSYRDGMENDPAVVVSTWEISVRAERGSATASFVNLPPDAPWRVAVSAVIEETSGEKSYWALAHPEGKPDFHHLDGFVLDLPADNP